MTNYITSVGVQQFSITIATGSLTGTATITAVGSGAFIVYGGNTCSSTANSGNNYNAYLTKTSSTVITATRRQTGGTVTVTGCIVDGDTTNLIKSVQFGTITIGGFGTSGTATISAVTANNTAVHHIGSASGNSSYNAGTNEAVLTLSGTTVTATIPTSNTVGIIVGFCIIEFQGTALNQAVQRVSAANSTSVASYTATITSVNTSNAILLYAGFNAGTVSSFMADSQQYAVLTNGTTVTVNLNTANAATKKFNCSVVEFVSGVLAASVQRGTTTLTGVTSNTSSITGVTANQSMVSYLGNSTSATTGVPDQAQGVVTLTSGTVVTVSKGTATSNITASWEVAQFTGASASITINSWYPETATPLNPLVPPYSFMSWLSDEILNLPIPFLPRLPDVPPQNPPAPPSIVAMNVQAIIMAATPLPWLPRIVDASPVTPQSKPNFFSNVFPLNFKLPWLPRISDAPLVTPQSKPNFFSNVFPLNFILPWLPTRVSGAPPIILSDKPNFFASVNPVNVAVTILSWLPRISDAAPVTPAQNKPNFFSNVFALNFRLPWLPRVVDAVPITPTQNKPNFFSDVFALNFKLPWLPRVVDAPPITPQSKPNYFAPFFRAVAATVISWFPIISRASPLAQPDRPNFFAPRPHFAPPPINPGDWVPGHPRPPAGRQAPPALQRFRQTAAMLRHLRGGEPSIQQLREGAAELQDHRAEQPKLQLLRKKPPTLT